MTATQTPARLKQRYEEEIRPALVEQFGYSSVMEAPRLEKITLNMGVGDGKQDSKLIEAATEQLALIAGQQPNVRRARKAIANFKLREEMPVGLAVTLRGERAYEFLDRLTSVAIPRIRDFRGLPARLDGRGNYTIGIREQIIFPEIDFDAVDQIRGLDISITTSARTDEEGRALLEMFGMPFVQVEEREPEPERPAPPPAPEAESPDEGPEAGAPADEPAADAPDDVPAADASADEPGADAPADEPAAGDQPEEGGGEEPAAAESEDETPEEEN
ncbi:MAG: 50S ribosomal protein L5 [Acidobacteria bacterium]|nr:50S ribosomal protein L5 [Acidobacteriota bacterium]